MIFYTTMFETVSELIFYVLKLNYFKVHSDYTYILIHYISITLVFNF